MRGASETRAPASALYLGNVRHRRGGNLRHRFRYPLFMLYLDLDELPRVFARRWLWSVDRPNLLWFRRADYLGEAQVPLAEAVRQLVAERTGRRPRGPIRLLTHLRTFGLMMNPVSFYYCFDESGATVEAIVAEVTNTPWGERFAYVLAEPGLNRAGGTQRFELAKEFHVSPFLPMDMDYKWRFSAPGERLVVHMENHSGGEKLFDATLALSRQPITGGTLARALVRFPWITAKVLAGIYWQAFLLFLKGAPFHTHPKKLATNKRRPNVPLPGAG